MNSPKAIQPRPHQLDALTDLARAFAVHDRARLVMACGTGKTFVGRWQAQAMEARTVLVLVPSLALLAQTIGEWRRVGGSRSVGSTWPFEALVVCSDPSTSAGAVERAADDAVSWPTWTKVRAKVTTSAAVATGFLTRQVDHPRVVFSTYHGRARTRLRRRYATAARRHHTAHRRRRRGRHHPPWLSCWPRRNAPDERSPRPADVTHHHSRGPTHPLVDPYRETRKAPRCSPSSHATRTRTLAYPLTI